MSTLQFALTVTITLGLCHNNWLSVVKNGRSELKSSRFWLGLFYNLMIYFYFIVFK